MSHCKYHLCGHFPTLSGWLGHDFSGHRTLSAFEQMVSASLGPVMGPRPRPGVGLLVEEMQAESVYIQMLAESSVDHLTHPRGVGEKYLALLLEVREKARKLVGSFTERPFIFCFKCDDAYGMCVHERGDLDAQVDLRAVPVRGAG